jgi:hypothetical protein
MTHALSSAEIGSAWKFHRDRYEPKTKAEVRAIAAARTEWGGRVARPQGLPRKLEIQIARVNSAMRSKDPEARKIQRQTLDHIKRVRRGLAKSMPAPEPILGPVPKREYPPEQIEIVGLLPNYYRPPVERLEPDYRVAARLLYVAATVYGPLTRRQQAEYAYTVAAYGEIIYASPAE